MVLTLDFEIQKAAMEALENGLGEIGLKAGAAVVTEVHSGDVVAMVSAPYSTQRIYTGYQSSALEPIPYQQAFTPVVPSHTGTLSARLHFQDYLRFGRIGKWSGPRRACPMPRQLPNWPAAHQGYRQPGTL